MYSKIALAIFIFLFPLSPHLKLHVFNSEITARFDDFFIPALFLIWLVEKFAKKKRIRFSPLYIPIGAFFAVGILATLLSHYLKHYSLNLAYTFSYIIRSAEYYIIFFLTVNILRSKKDFIIFGNLFSAAACLLAIYGAFDHIYGVSGATGLYDAGWFYHQSNHIGGYLMIALVLVLGLWDMANKKIYRLTYCAVLLLIAYAILFNLSRTTYISSLVALLVYFAMGRKKLIIIPIVLSLLLFVAIPKLFPNTILGARISTISTDVLSSRTDPIDQFDSMALHRAKLRRVFNDFPRDFIFGKGVGYFQLFEYDNQYAMVLVATGIVGAFIFIWMLSAILKLILIIHKNSVGPLRDLSQIFIAVFAGMIVHGAASTAFMIAVLAYAFWWLLGAVVAYAQNTHE